jgi:hypothetical protein
LDLTNLNLFFRESRKNSLWALAHNSCDPAGYPAEDGIAGPVFRLQISVLSNTTTAVK